MDKVPLFHSIGMLTKITEDAEPRVLTELRRRLGDDATLERVTPNLPWYSVEAQSLYGLSPGASFERAHELLSITDLLAIEPEFEPDTPILEEPIGGVQGNNLKAVAAGEEPDQETSGKYSWHLDQVNAKVARDLFGVNGAGVRVAHPDTGYTLHPELVIGAAVRPDLGYNFKERKPSPIEPLGDFGTGHGTSTASVLVGIEGKQHNFPNDDSFVEGVAPAAELVPMRVDNNVFWIFSAKNDVKAIDRAIDKGCHVISMSRGGPDKDSLKDAIKRALNRGLIVVAAASNCNAGCDKIFSPANYPGVVCAAGSTYAKTPWTGSSRGPEVTLSAPAHLVYRARTAKSGSAYRYSVERSSGTSYATPIIAGAAALWIERHGGPDAIAQKLGGLAQIPIVFKHLLKTAGYHKPVPDWPESFGPGILDCTALLSATLPALDRMPAIEQDEREMGIKFAIEARSSLTRSVPPTTDGRAARLLLLELETAALQQPTVGLSRQGGPASALRRPTIKEESSALDLSPQLRAVLTRTP